MIEYDNSPTYYGDVFLPISLSMGKFNEIGDWWDLEFSVEEGISQTCRIIIPFSEFDYIGDYSDTLVFKFVKGITAWIPGAFNPTVLGSTINRFIRLCEDSDDGHSYDPATNIATWANPAASTLKKLPAPTLTPTYYDDDSEPLKKLVKLLPSIDTEVDLPCECENTKKRSLMNAVMHLNDVEKWSRERIADWVDILHDSGMIDIEFKIPDKKEENDSSN